MPQNEKFERVRGQEIVKEFINARRHRTDDRQMVTGLGFGPDLPVWTLSRGHDHRGATLFDEEQGVIWLLAYGRHRSGTKHDFYKVCPALAREDRLLPTDDDQQRMLDDRGERFVDSLMVEAPLVLKMARESGEEVQTLLGGHLGAGVAVEVAGEAEATHLAIDITSLDGDLVPLTLAAFHADVDGWESSDRLPSRALRETEVGFVHVHESEIPK